MFIINNKYGKTNLNKSMLAFIHMRKCVGTTMISILRANYLLRHADITVALNIPRRFLNLDDLRFALRINPFILSIASHKLSPVGKLENLIPNIRYFAIFRDPKARYISDFLYKVEIEKRTLLNFEKFLSRERFNDHQTKAIAGISNVNAAIEMLEKRLWLVGISESFDEFLLMLKKKLSNSSFDIRYKSRRVATERNSKSRIFEKSSFDFSFKPRKVAIEHNTKGKILEKGFEKYEDIIYENNKNDYQLYNYVKDIIIPRQRKEYGDDLEKDLANFKKELITYKPDRFVEFLCLLYRRLYYNPLLKLYRCINS